MSSMLWFPYPNFSGSIARLGYKQFIAMFVNSLLIHDVCLLLHVIKLTSYGICYKNTEIELFLC